MNGFVLLSLREREKLKTWGANSRDIALDYGQWHRFLNDVYKTTFVPFDVKPSFEEYRSWLMGYPGWSYGEIVKGHTVYDLFKDRPCPMNEYYKKEKRNG